MYTVPDPEQETPSRPRLLAPMFVQPAIVWGATAGFLWGAIEHVLTGAISPELAIAAACLGFFIALITAYVTRT